MTVHKNGGSEDGPSLDRLIKFLRLTTSETDGEALAAVRMANRELKKIGGDWEALLRGKVTIITDPFLDGTVAAAAQRHSQPTFRPPAPPPPRRPAPQPQAQASAPPGWQPNVPPPPQPQPAPRPGFTATIMRTGQSNRFAAKCHICRVAVPIGAGLLCSSPGGWLVEHPVCPPKASGKKTFVGTKTVDDIMNL